MILHTARLTLRRARPDDLEEVYAMMSRPAAMRYWSTPEHETLAETKAWLASMISAIGTTSNDFLIERDGRVIGKAGAWKLPEIGYLIHPDHWGQGFAHEAISAVIPYLFATHAVPALTAEIEPRNAASWHLLLKLGFAETGRASRTMQWRDEWRDSVYFALPRP